MAPSFAAPTVHGDNFPPRSHTAPAPIRGPSSVSRLLSLSFLRGDSAVLLHPDGSLQLFPLGARLWGGSGGAGPSGVTSVVTVADIMRLHPGHDVDSLTSSRTRLAPEKRLRPGSTYCLVPRKEKGKGKERKLPGKRGDVKMSKSVSEERVPKGVDSPSSKQYDLPHSQTYPSRGQSQQQRPQQQKQRQQRQQQHLFPQSLRRNITVGAWPQGDSSRRDEGVADGRHARSSSAPEVESSLGVPGGMSDLPPLLPPPVAQAATGRGQQPSGRRSNFWGSNLPRAGSTTMPRAVGPTAPDLPALQDEEDRAFLAFLQESFGRSATFGGDTSARELLASLPSPAEQLPFRPLYGVAVSTPWMATNFETEDNEGGFGMAPLTPGFSFLTRIKGESASLALGSQRQESWA